MLKKSIVIKGHSTSVLLEPIFWDMVERIAKYKKVSIPNLISEIDETRVKSGNNSSLASAIRVFALEYLIFNFNISL